ncbi:MAG: aldehyde ferredoxin oxidoreductase family protein [Pseudomonadota bacterium]
MKGYVGRIAHVDLVSGHIEYHHLEPELISKYIGGRGINSAILFNTFQYGEEPLSPGTPIVFGVGPLVGTMAPSAGRSTISSKSPMTGLFGDANVGGRFGPALKFAGFDHLIVTGRSETPVYLFIRNKKVEIRSAAALWGHDTWHTEDTIRAELKNDRVEVACIGRAGENLVAMACIITNKSRAAGRSGMGAVMGSKKLKAVAVLGEGSISVADPQRLKEITVGLIRKIQKAYSYPLLSEYGTQHFTATNYLGAFVIRNYSQSHRFETYSKVSPSAIRKKHYKGREACFACPIACGHHCEVKKGEFAGEKGGGLEHGCTTPFGVGCGNDNTGSFVRFNNQCNRYGIDAVEFGSLLGAVIEWYRNGLITQFDLGGYTLDWGDYRGMLRLLDETANLEKFGRILAKGSVQAAGIVGKNAESYLSHGKKMSFAADDVRPFKGYALSLATATRGADHLRGIPIEEIFYSVTDTKRAISYDKAPMVIYYQNMNTLADALGVCKFNTKAMLQAIGIEEMVALYQAVTGLEFAVSDFIQVADRIYDLERMMLAYEGVTRKDDILIGKFMLEPVQDGPFKGQRIELAKFNELLDDYYRLRGWNVETGNPESCEILSKVSKLFSAHPRL